MEMQSLSPRKSASNRSLTVQFAPESDHILRNSSSTSSRSKLTRAQTLSADPGNAQLRPKMEKRLRRYESVIALEELVQCGICLSRLRDPKMLPCQHTFCHNCVKMYLQQRKANSIECPVCKAKSLVDNVDALPSNIYLNNLISLLMSDTDEAPGAPIEAAKQLIVNGATKSCATCSTMCQEQNIIKCQHCTMDYCGVCFPQHADELTARYPDFLKQLDDHQVSLTLEQIDYKRHCDLLVQDIKEGFARKIEELKNKEETMLQDVLSMHQTGGMEILHISSKVTNLKTSIEKQTETKAHNKVMIYMDYHQQMSQILDTISSLAANYKQFNIATFQLDAPPSPQEQTTNFIYDEIRSSQVSSPAMLLTYYKNKVFTPKSVYAKFQKPTGVCFSPWDANQVYVCNLKTIYVYDITIGKVTARIQDDSMTCPQSIACDYNASEIFVSDKWKNVVHVFDKDGIYIRKLAPKSLSNPHGIALSKDGDLLLCDTGNDLILIIDTTSGRIKNTIGVVGGLTELSMPMDVATDGKIIVVADVGNHRVKIFNADTLLRTNEIGSSGRQKGQFRSAEVVHVDEGGFILVGDSGNRRIQIFDSNGNFVQCTSSDYKFNSISGICTNNKADIIVTDYKSKSLVRF